MQFIGSILGDGFRWARRTQKNSSIHWDSVVLRQFHRAKGANVAQIRNADPRYLHIMLLWYVNLISLLNLLILTRCGFYNTARANRRLFVEITRVFALASAVAARSLTCCEGEEVEIGANAVTISKLN